jgi:hypothetical protein
MFNGVIKEETLFKLKIKVFVLSFMGKSGRLGRFSAD